MMNIADAIVFIVDDDAAVRDSLTLMIVQASITVKAYDSAESFLNTCQTEHYGCAIIDIRMPSMDGLQLQEALSKRKVLMPVIFLTGHGDIPMSVKAMKAGAVDFLTKPITRERLINSVHAAILKSEKILQENTNHKEAQLRLAELTDREQDVMMLAIQGYQNKEIARHLGISHRTVEIHKSKIMFKTNATNLLDLARIAHESGLDN